MKRVITVVAALVVLGVAAAKVEAGTATMAMNLASAAVGHHGYSGHYSSGYRSNWCGGSYCGPTAVTVPIYPTVIEPVCPSPPTVILAPPCGPRTVFFHHGRRF
jgi:hypothetical protein